MKTTIRERRRQTLAALTEELMEKHNVTTLLESDNDYQLEVSISAKEARDIIHLFACEVGCRSHMALSLAAVARGAFDHPRMYELKKKAGEIVDQNRGN